jgi:hypothetical protein
VCELIRQCIVYVDSFLRSEYMKITRRKRHMGVLDRDCAVCVLENTCHVFVSVPCGRGVCTRVCVLKSTCHVFVSVPCGWGVCTGVHTFCIDILLGTSFGNRSVECRMAFVPEISSFLDCGHCL